MSLLRTAVFAAVVFHVAARFALSDPVKVVLDVDGAKKNESKKYPGGVPKSDLTAAEAKDVRDRLNKMIGDAIGPGMIQIVPPEGNADVPRKLFVNGGGGDRGETWSRSNESFVNVGTLAASQPAKGNRASLLNAIVFSAKHELVHLIGGLDNSDHGCEWTQSVKDAEIKDAEDEQQKLDKQRKDSTATQKFRDEAQRRFDHNKTLIDKMKAMPAVPVNVFTKGENVSNTEVSAVESEIFTDRLKDALKAGVQKIQGGVQPGLPPDAPPEPGRLTPIRGPRVGPFPWQDNHPDFDYTITSPFLGPDLLNPQFTLGLFDASGAYVPFKFDSRGAIDDPLTGFLTLEAGYAYEFVLENRLTGEFIRSTSPEATLSFEPLLEFPASQASLYGDFLTGPYFGAAGLAFDIDQTGTPDVFVNLESHSLLTFDRSNGLTDSLNYIINPDARLNAVPEPSTLVLAIVGLLSLSRCAFRRSNRRQGTVGTKISNAV